MASNPFAGTDLAEPWQQGFVAGFLAPDDDHTPPSPFTPEAQDAYAKGAATGRDAVRGLALPPTPRPAKAGVWKDIIHGTEAGKVLIEVVTAAKDVANVALGGALEVFISVAVFGPDRSEPFFEEGAASAMRRVMDELTKNGVISDNLDLFMAACDRTDHDGSDHDELTRQGFFHGSVFLDFDQASAEAQAHSHPGDTVVLHFQTASPDEVEVIELTMTAAGVP